MTTGQVLLLATAVYAALFGATIWFTRATRRRVWAALAGGAAVAVVGPAIEHFCQMSGFWRYTVDAPYGPALMYPLVILVFAMLSLLGWRSIRRFGSRGWITLVAAVLTLGTLRDFFLADRALGFISVRWDLVSALVDAACWGVSSGLALAIMRWVGGPAGGDPLARQDRIAGDR